MPAPQPRRGQTFATLGQLIRYGRPASHARHPLQTHWPSAWDLLKLLSNLNVFRNLLCAGCSRRRLLSWPPPELAEEMYLGARVCASAARNWRSSLRSILHMLRRRTCCHCVVTSAVPARRGCRQRLSQSSMPLAALRAACRTAGRCSQQSGPAEASLVGSQQRAAADSSHCCYSSSGRSTRHSWQPALHGGRRRPAMRGIACRSAIISASNLL